MNQSLVSILASMVTPFGLTIAYFLGKIIRKNIFNRQEIDTLKTAFPMGICQITEGCFPIVLNDLERNVIATGVGGAVGGGLSMFWGADSRIPASGMFAVATMTRLMGIYWCIVSWFFVTGITILLLKKPVDPNAEIIQEEKEEEDISWDDLTIS